MKQAQTLAKESTFQRVEGEKEGKYIYCIIGANEPREYSSIGIGGNGDMVQTFCHDGIAVILSDSPVKKYPINRKNTISHQKVMEEVMKYHTVLPVRFSTIAEDKEPEDGSPKVPALERVRQRVLIERRQEFIELLKDMDTKLELGVKALWTDMKGVFIEIVEETPTIKKLKEKIERINITNPRQSTHRERVKLGEMVRDTLNTKRKKLKNIIMGVLKKASFDTRVNKNFGDNMIVNGAFLVEKAKIGDFENNIEKLVNTYEGKIKFKYVGPVPPCNFVEIVITWE
ncbi:MAG: gas vesicle protein [Candidatus Scalindua rubra]|uniref:Gas vesicle protein n=1 Tax=Candidatus Scalindua rubra TaxID=1872076 RepID=A0A1E3XF69_9BACT|nr:MAG: gas vesicle protein [Candidatus Scalindua rubra]